MKKLSFVLIAILAAIILYSITSTTHASAASSSLQSSYSYIKTHTIQGSTDGSLADYPVQLIVHRGMGTDSGQHVYLNQRPMSWPADIRFTDSEGKQLSYWIESSDKGKAVVWVKLGFIPQSPGTTTLNVHYGKAGDSGASVSMDVIESHPANEPIHRGWSAETAASDIASAPAPTVTPAPTARPTTIIATSASPAVPGETPVTAPPGPDRTVLLIVGIVAMIIAVSVALLVLLIIIVVIDQRMNP